MVESWHTAISWSAPIFVGSCICSPTLIFLLTLLVAVNAQDITSLLKTISRYQRAVYEVVNGSKWIATMLANCKSEYNTLPLELCEDRIHITYNYILFYSQRDVDNVI